MTYSVVTTFSPKGYEVYGRMMIESFGKHWPEDVPLYAYFEGDSPPDGASERATWMPLDADQDRARFLESAPPDPAIRMNYKESARRFCHKVFAMTGAPRNVDHLMFIDADCVSFSNVTAKMLEMVSAGAGQVAAYLGRPQRHTETGFLSFQINSGGGDFLDALRKVYTSGEIFKLKERHDCAAFDHVRGQLEKRGQKFKNLCPGAQGLGVFDQSPLRYFIRHNKGPNKRLKVYGHKMLGD